MKLINKKLNIFKQLYVQVILAIIFGLILGYFYPDFATKLKPLGDGFINLVKMIISPVIFLTITLGIASIGSVGKVGRIVGKSLVYFFFFSTLALILGMIVSNLLQPGLGLHINVMDLETGNIQQYVDKSNMEGGLVSFFMSIIPKSLLSPLVGDNILQVLLISILFGIALSSFREKATNVINFLENLMDPIFKIVSMIMKLAPIGAFGAIAFTIGKYGIYSLLNLIYLVIVFYMTSILFVVFILGIVARFNGFSIFKLLVYLKDEILLVIATSSSESALPNMMSKMEKVGCDKSVVGLVVPTGYSFNLDGTNIYMTMAALFIAQACDINLSLGEQILLLVMAMISSKGAAGVTGGGFITLAATLSIVPSVPIAGMALILGIDKFMSECRAVVNFIGNACATIVIAKWEKSLDEELLKKFLK